MIISSLRAENFRKYTLLRVASFPERGMIGIVGANESGKTTVGEALSFALFGRTVRASADHIEDVISWGAERTTVAVDFKVDGGDGYRIIREIDRSGTNHARLMHSGGEELLAAGVGAVAESLRELVGLSFEEFRYSFYLGQRELDWIRSSSSKHRRKTLEAMAGVDRIEAALAAARTQLVGARAALAETKERERLAERLWSELAPAEEGYGEAETRLQSLREELEVRRGALDAARKDEEEAQARLEAARRVRAHSAWLGVLGAGEMVGQLRRWIEDRMGILSRELAEARVREQELAARRADLDEAWAALEELRGLARMRQSELEAQLKNDLEQVYDQDQGDLITPDGKSEQLAYTQRRLEECGDEEERLLARARFRTICGICFCALGAIFLMGFDRPDWRFAFFLVFGILYMMMGLIPRTVATDLRDRRERLDANRTLLSDQVEKCRRSLAACEALLEGTTEELTSRVGEAGSPQMTEVARRIGSVLDGLEGRSMEEARDELRREVEREQAAVAEREALLLDLEGLAGELASGFEQLHPEGRSVASDPSGSISDNPDGGAPDLALWRGRVRRVLGKGHRWGLSLETRAEEGVHPYKDTAAFEAALALLEARGFEGLLPDLAALSSGTLTASLPELMELLESLEKALQSGTPQPADLASSLEEARRECARIERDVDRLGLEERALQDELERHGPGRRRLEEIGQELEQIQSSLVDLQHRIEVREALVSLLRSLKDRVLGRLRPGLEEFMAQVLPGMTAGRYADVQVSEDLSIRAHSTEKGDTVDLDQLSGGTVEQVLVALRLALSKALIQARLGPDQGQYLFLDEPVASFDRGRSEGFLELLKRIEDDFQQVFVITHVEGLEERFDAILKTSLGVHELDTTLL